jgi:flagella basal body P-ring formation protein FlgA
MTFIFILCMGLELFAHDELQPVLELYLKKSCLVEGPELSFRELVQSYSDHGVFNQLLNLRFPINGDRFTLLPARTIRETVKHEYSGMMILVGQRVSLMPKKFVKPETTWFYEALLDYLGSSDKFYQARIEVEIISLSETLRGSGDCIQFEINQAQTRNGMKVGPAKIIYRYIAGSVPVSGSIDVVLHVIVPAAVPVATIRAGESFGDEKLSGREVDLSQYNEDILLVDSVLTSCTAASELLSGEPIPVKKISRTLFVRSGDKVSITFSRKNLTVQVKGRALSSGSVDEKVSIKPDGTDHKFQGLITGEKEVAVELR